MGAENSGYIESQYALWKSDPGSVSREWARVTRRDSRVDSFTAARAAWAVLICQGGGVRNPPFARRTCAEC
jgi:hypothetical protein